MLFTPHSRRQLHPSNIVTQEMVPDDHKSSISSALTPHWLWYICQVSNLQLPLGVQLRQPALPHSPQLRLAARLRPPGKKFPQFLVLLEVLKYSKIKKGGNILMFIVNVFYRFTWGTPGCSTSWPPPSSSSYWWSWWSARQTGHSDTPTVPLIVLLPSSLQ